MFGLGFRLRPATPGWGVGVCVCSCAHSACTPPLLAGVCGVGQCGWARVSATPRHSWLGCSGVCVFVCPLCLYPASPGWGVWCGCVCSGSGFGCAPRLLAGVLGCVYVCVRAPLVLRHSWFGCVVWVCVLGLRFQLAPHSWLGSWDMFVFVCPLRLYPATPGWGVWCGCVFVLGFRLRPATPGWAVGVCVCSCARSACSPPLLAGVCGVGVCAWARVSAAPFHSWLGCWGVCVFLCPLLMYPGTPGWGVRRRCVCLGSSSAAPRHSWLGCSGVCAYVCALRLYPATPGWGVLCGVCAWAGASAAPHHSWLGCWGVCVFVCALRLYPATPGWGLWCGCVCLGSGFGCAPPLLVGVLGCVCVCVPTPLVRRHSLLGCVVWVCALQLGFRLRPATPGWGVRVCVCLCACSACTPPLLAGVCGEGVCAPARVSAAPRHSWLGCSGVCVFVCPLRLYPATPGWGVCCGCVCSGSGFGYAPPLRAGVWGCVCVCVRAPLVPRHSWLGCVVWVCVLGLGFRLRPATPGWGVGVCVCLFARSACTPPLPAGVCGVWVGCCPEPVPVPWFIACCARCPGLRHPVAAVAWHLSVCRGCGWRCASLACLVAPRWCAAPRPVRSLSVLRSALPTPCCLSPSRGLAPPDSLGGCAGHEEAGREPGSLCLPLAPAEAGALGSLCVVPVWGPAMGLSLAGPSGVSLGLRALRWLACADPVTDASGFPYRPSFDGGLGRCTGADSCGRRHRPFLVGGRHARVPRVCACACVAWPGRAGRPPGRVLVRLTFSCGRFVLLLFLAPSGLGSPCLLWCFFLCALVVSSVPCFPAHDALGLGVLFAPPFFSLFLFFFAAPRLVFFFTPPFCFVRGVFLFFFFRCLVCFFFPLPCLLFFFCAGCRVRGRFLCLWLWGVLVCGAVGAAACGVLCVLPGAVWRACALLGSRALLSGAVLRLVLLGCFCCSLLSHAAVFSAGFFLFALFRAFPW